MKKIVLIIICLCSVLTVAAEENKEKGQEPTNNHETTEVSPKERLFFLKSFLLKYSLKQKQTASTNQQENSKSEGCGLPWMTFLLGILIGSCAMWCVWKRKKIRKLLKSKGKTTNPPTDDSGGHLIDTDSIESNNPESLPAPNNPGPNNNNGNKPLDPTEGNGGYANDNPNNDNDIINELVMTYPQLFEGAITNEDKRGRIIHYINQYQEDHDLSNKIKEALECEKEEDIISYIRLLKKRQEPIAPQPHDWRDLEEYIKEIIKSKDNGYDILKKVLEEYLNQDKPFEVKRFFKIVESKIRSNNKPGKSIEELLRHLTPDENHKLKNHFLMVLKNQLGNIIETQSNTTFESYIDKLKSKLQSGSTIEDLSEADRQLLFEKLIFKVNEKLPSDKKLTSVSTIDDLCKFLINSLNKPIDNDTIAAEQRGSDRTIQAISKAIGLPIESDNSDELKIVLQKFFMQRLKGKLLDKAKLTQGEMTDDDFLGKVLDVLKNGKDIEDLLRQYNVGAVGNLEDAFKENEMRIIRRNTQNLPNDIQLEDCTSTQKMVNKIVKALNQARTEKDEAEREKEKELRQAEKDKIAMETSLMELVKLGYSIVVDKEMDETSTLEEAFNIYNNEVKMFKRKTNDTILTKEQQNSQLSQKVAQQSKQIETQEEVISSITNSYAEKFNHGVAELEHWVGISGYMKACDNMSKRLCKENEERMQATARDFAEKANNLQFGKKSPEKFYTTIQNFLTKELADENSILCLIAHYYAYSRLAFMTDKTRNYGIYFERKRLTQMFTNVTKLLSDFGIQLIIPTLFSERVSEGDFEDCTGAEYGDLDNICPQSVNYKENIPNPDTKDIVIDMIRPGYAINGVTINKAKVII